MTEKRLEREFVQRHTEVRTSKTGQRCEWLGKTAAADSSTWHLAVRDEGMFENKGSEENRRQRQK